MGKPVSRKPYDKRTDIEKIESNWNKIKGLFERREWSSAVVRAATAAEIATNLAIREELQHERKLDAAFVDSLLKWANGIQGKFSRLLLPLSKETDRYEVFRKLNSKVKSINDARNSVAHRGEFKSKRVAKHIVTKARALILEIVGMYHSHFDLREIE